MKKKSVKERVFEIISQRLTLTNARSGETIKIRGGIRIKETFWYSNLEDLMNLLDGELQKRKLVLQWTQEIKDDVVQVFMHVQDETGKGDAYEHTGMAMIERELGGESAQIATTNAKKSALINCFNIKQITKEQGTSEIIAKKEKNGKDRSAKQVKAWQEHARKLCKGNQKKMIVLAIAVCKEFNCGSYHKIPRVLEDGSKVNDGRVKSAMEKHAKVFK